MRHTLLCPGLGWGAAWVCLSLTTPPPKRAPRLRGWGRSSGEVSCSQQNEGLITWRLVSCPLTDLGWSQTRDEGRSGGRCGRAGGAVSVAAVVGGGRSLPLTVISPQEKLPALDPGEAGVKPSSPPTSSVMIGW